MLGVILSWGMLKVIDSSCLLIVIGFYLLWAWSNANVSLYPWLLFKIVYVIYYNIFRCMYPRLLIGCSHSHLTTPLVSLVYKRISGLISFSFRSFRLGDSTQVRHGEAANFQWYSVHLILLSLLCGKVLQYLTKVVLCGNRFVNTFVLYKCPVVEFCLFRKLGWDYR